ncbi:hypothetical protein ACFPRL_31690 [Pseudoclavibacter helvolus]
MPGLPFCSSSPPNCSRSSSSAVPSPPCEPSLRAARASDSRWT